MLNRTIIRDPLYGPVELDPVARELVDSRVFQRLRRVQQLALASLVYPSAMHTRFEHSVGVYHLARTIIEGLDRRGELTGISEDEIRIVPLAGLLHDTAQSISGHLLEEFGLQGVEHEEAGAMAFEEGEIGAALSRSGIPGAARQIGDIMNQRSANPLAGLIAGNCDADKIDYIARDAYHCGLAVGFDQEHLRQAITLLRDPATGHLRVGIDASGLNSFEAMLYSKGSLFRTVYFHRSVRAAMSMLRLLMVMALEKGLIQVDEIHRWSDSELFTVLRVRAASKLPAQSLDAEIFDDLIDRILSRRLFHRACSFPFGAVRRPSAERTLAIEVALAEILGLPRSHVALDIPDKPTMLATDVLVQMRDGSIRNARDLGPDDGFALNSAQPALYAASGSAGVFTAEPRVVDPATVIGLIEAMADSPVALAPERPSP
jgi:uncharacterized protein